MVRCICVGLGLFMVAGCSDHQVRSGVQISAMSGSANAAGGTEASRTGAESTVMFRCEEGRLGAYVVTGEFEGEPAEDQMVRISLDSAPDC